VQLHRARSEFEDAGVPLVLIGQATARQAAHFRKHYAPDLPVLADERRESYRAAGTKMGSTAELVGPKSVLAGATRTLRSGGKVMQGRVIGNAAQLGGALVITPGGQVTWSHISEHAGDNASPHEILAAAREAATAPPDRA
jgi:alkyl-hydroperoxide reductase/thiol specific antioxidant family protein